MPDKQKYREPGTRVEMHLKKSFIDSIQARREPLEHFDPITAREVDYFSGILSHLPVPVLVNGKIRGDSKLTSLQWHYIDEHNAAVALDLDEDSRSWAHLFFKGQRVGLADRPLELPCRVYVDVFGNAEELLSVNRRYFRNTKVLERVQAAITVAAAQALEKNSRKDHRTLLSTLLLALEKPATDEYLEVRWLEPSDTSYYARRYRYVKNIDKATFPTVGELLKSDAKLYHVFGDYSPRYLRVKDQNISSVDNSLSVFIKAIIHQGYKGYIDTVTTKGVTIGWSKTREAWDTDALRKLLLESIIPGLRLALPVTKDFAPLASFKWTPWVGEISRSPQCPNCEYMYSPFIVENGKITTSSLDVLVNWTFAHRTNSAVTEEEIRRCYQDFILLVDQAMRNEPRWTSVIGYTI